VPCRVSAIHPQSRRSDTDRVVCTYVVLFDGCQCFELLSVLTPHTLTGHRRGANSSPCGSKPRRIFSGKSQLYQCIGEREANKQHRQIYGRCPVCRDYMLQLVTLRIPPPCSPMADLIPKQVTPVSFTDCNDSTPSTQVSSWPCICFMHSKSSPLRPQHQESYVSSAHTKMEGSPFVGAWPYQEFGQ